MFEEFWEENKSFLKDFYPGLTLKILKRELENYSDNFECLEKQLLLGVPLSYITGERFFYNQTYFVNKHVLIPRYETEYLVDWCINKIFPKGKVLDLCCGSGNVGLSILKDLDFTIDMHFSDFSSKALEVAKWNAYSLEYSLRAPQNIFFHQADRGNIEEKEFDFVVTNPPYIKPSDSKFVHPQVLRFAPHMALFVENYNEWFREFFKGIYKLLKKGGSFCMEGHEDHLEGLKGMANEEGFCDIILETDLSGRLRYMMGRKEDGKN